MKIVITFALLLILIAPATAVNVTKVEIHGVVFDEKSNVYNTTLLWDAQNFTGFWYNPKGGKSSEMGEGYNLTVESIDTKTSPRQAWLSFSKNGTILDNRVVREGEVYTYTEKSLSGESDVPVFVTYIESIFTGAEGTATFVQLRYTWLISQDP